MKDPCLPFISAACSFIVLCLENSLTSFIAEKQGYLPSHRTQGRYQELVFMADLDLGKSQCRAQVSAQTGKLGLVKQERKDPEECFHSDDGCRRSPG